MPAVSERPKVVTGLGQFIREERQKRGLKPYELAVLCGVSPMTVALYESREMQPRINTLQRFAAGLGIDPIVLATLALSRKT